MPRKLDLVINTCSECPYCMFETAIGDNFCHADPEPTELSYVDLENWNITKGIPPMCPLPYIKEEDAHTPTISEKVAKMYREGGITGADGKKLLDDIAEEPTFKCTALQVPEINGCPEEWLRRVYEEEKAYVQRAPKETEHDVELLFEGFDENDEPWDHQK